MNNYYKELIKFAPHTLQITERNDLKQLWTFEAYPCLDILFDFYECFQSAEDIRTSFFNFLPIEKTYIKSNGLVFASGHQNTYPIGIELSDLVYEDPRVKYQTHENGRWFNESGSLRSFLFNVSAWQILNTMASVARIDIRKDEEFEKMIGDCLFYLAQDRSYILRSNYRTCRDINAEILAIYNILEGTLYFGANDDETLNDFSDKFHIELDWL